MSVIAIRGAKEHNLKNIDIDIPKNKLVVITGLSGSGKSSLAYDTLYAEGQRRYVESLSSYARQFLGRMSKPEVDSITGISPAIAIEQKVPGSYHASQFIMDYLDASLTIEAKSFKAEVNIICNRYLCGNPDK